MDLVSSLSTSIDIVKKLRELNKKVGEAEFKMLLADLSNELADAKLEAANLKSELAQAKDDVSRLESAASRNVDSGPDVHEGAYVFGDNSRHYCTSCYDGSGSKVLLHQLSGPFTVFGKWQCPSCKSHFGPSN